MEQKEKSIGGQRGKEKKEETIRNRQEAQKKKLLEILEESPNIGAALSRIGINRSTFSRWRADNPVFTVETDKAIEHGIEKTADNVELALLNEARNGDVRAQKYYLGNNHKRYQSRKRDEEILDNILTDERKKQIADTVRAWSSVNEDEDERDEDYEIPTDVSEDKDSKEINALKIISACEAQKVDEHLEVDTRCARKNIATYYKLKKKK